MTVWQDAYPAKPKVGTPFLRMLKNKSSFIYHSNIYINPPIKETYAISDISKGPYIRHCILFSNLFPGLKDHFMPLCLSNIAVSSIVTLILTYLSLS